VQRPGVPWAPRVLGGDKTAIRALEDWRCGHRGESYRPAKLSRDG
jgi:hypothetical protein